jgi:hypothetical protein
MTKQIDITTLRNCLDEGHRPRYPDSLCRFRGAPLVSDRLVPMRSVAVLLCVALFGLNAEAAMLHVHQGDADSDHHHHSPAAHIHKIHVELTPVDTAVETADDDSSAIPVVLAKATACHIYYLLASSQHVIALEAPASSHVPQFVITARAHGPPAGRSCSLRAPPRSFLL